MSKSERAPYPEDTRSGIGLVLGDNFDDTIRNLQQVDALYAIDKRVGSSGFIADYDREGFGRAYLPISEISVLTPRLWIVPNGFLDREVPRESGNEPTLYSDLIEIARATEESLEDAKLEPKGPFLSTYLFDYEGSLLGNLTDVTNLQLKLNPDSGTEVSKQARHIVAQLGPDPVLDLAKDRLATVFKEISQNPMGNRAYVERDIIVSVLFNAMDRSQRTGLST